MTSVRDSTFKFLIEYLSDKHHHGALVFCLQKIGNTRKVTGCFCFSTRIKHGAHAAFEIMCSLR